MSYNNTDLVNAFPSYLRDDVCKVVEFLPERDWSTETFSVSVGAEVVAIPYRIYLDPALIDLTSLTNVQGELAHCLLTRHRDGFIREANLAKILHSQNEWVPPFVVRLVGEYVVEILRVIGSNLDQLDPRVYRAFLRDNPRFLALMKHRMISYWDCYYRSQRLKDYEGFRVIRFLDELIASR